MVKQALWESQDRCFFITGKFSLIFLLWDLWNLQLHTGDSLDDVLYFIVISHNRNQNNFCHFLDVEWFIDKNMYKVFVYYGKRPKNLYTKVSDKMAYAD